MKNKSISAMIVGAASLGVSIIAFAQTSSPVKPQYEIPGGDKVNEDAPRGIALADGVAFYPAVELGVGRDDNLFVSNSNKKSSTFGTLRPGFKFQARSANAIYTVDFDANSTQYQDSSDDNFNDRNIRGSADFIVTSSMGFRLNGDYNRGHDPRGSTDRGFSSRPDVFINNGPSAIFAYGANDAAGRIELEGGTFRKSYENNFATTAASKRDTTNYAGRFFMRIAPKTSLLLEARNEKFDYASPTSLQDSKEQRLLVGVTWDATAATSGTVKAGRIKKDFSSPTLKDFSGTGWEAAIAWTPMTYSKFDFYTNKSFSESTGFGDFTLTKRYGAAWTHAWNSRFSTIANISRADDEFATTSRNDSTDSLGLKVVYKLMRGVQVGGEYNYVDRDSSISTFRYKRNIFLLTLGATL